MKHLSVVNQIRNMIWTNIRIKERSFDEQLLRSQDSKKDSRKQIIKNHKNVVKLIEVLDDPNEEYLCLVFE